MRAVVLFCLAALALQVAHAQQCSGQVSGVTWTPASRVPGTATQNVVVVFTIVNDLAAGDTFSITYPSGFLLASAAVGILPTATYSVGSQGATSVLVTVKPSQTVTAGQITITLTTATMGSAMVGSCTGVTVGPTQTSAGVTKDLVSAGVASGSLGGQVSVTAWTPASRVPGTTGQALTVTFTIQTALAVGDTVVFTYPSGFILTTGALSVAAGGFQTTTAITPGSATSFTATAAAIVAVGSVTVTFTGANMGVAMGENLAGIKVGPTATGSVVKDIQSAGFPSGVLGGQVTVTAWTPASRVPGATSQALTVTFTIQTALAIGDTVVFTYPSGFILTTGALSVATGGFQTATAITPGSATSFTATAAAIVAVGSVTVTFTGANMGTTAVVGACDGIKVGPTATGSAVKDIQSAGIASGVLGGQVTVTAWTPASRVPGATSQALTVTFTLQTALAIGDTVVFTYPSGFILTTGALSVAAGGFQTATAITPGSATSFTATAAAIVAVGSVTVTFTGANMGVAMGENLAGIKVGPTATGSVVKDIQSAGFPSGPLGGQVTAVSMSIAGGLLPGATGAATKAVVAFTPSSPLIQGQFVTIGFPSGYISGANAVDYTVANTFGTVTATGTTGYTILIGNVVGGLPAAAVTLTLTGATLGSLANFQQAGCSAGVWVATDKDLRSVNSVTTQALGGMVSAVSSTIAPADRVPLATTKNVIVNFKIQSALATGNTVTINWAGANGPVASSSYVTGVSGVTYATTANVFTFGSAITNGVTLTIGSVAAIAGTAYTVTLTGATIGLAAAATANGISVSTTNDAAATGPTVAIGGQITGVAVSIAAADRVPAATLKAVTVSFTTQTALTSGQLVTITFPSSFFAGTIAVTAAATFAATTGTIGTTGLTIAIGSAGAAVGSYTLTLTGVTMVAQPATPAPTGACNNNFFVNTPNDLSGGAILPAIGGVVTGVSFSVALADRVPAAAGKSVTVSFTTQTVLASTQTVVVTFPGTYIGNTIGVTYAGAANTFLATTTVATGMVTMTVGTAGAVAASYTVTLTGATMGPPIAASATTGVSVYTTTDNPGMAGYPALGGTVTGTTLTIATVDRMAMTNRKVIVSFTTTTALVSSNSITVKLPLGLVSAIAASPVVTPTGIISGAALSGNNIVLTVGATGVAAGATTTVTICGVTLGSFSTNNMYGVQVTTTNDYTTVCSATGIVAATGGQVTAVSMTMPFFNRIAANTAQAVTFAFTTATALPATSAGCSTAANFNSVSIVFPSNFFVANVASSCSVAAAALSVTGLNGYTLTANAVGPTTTTTFVLTGTGPLPAAAYTVTISGLTLGAQMPGSDTGISVSTSMTNAAGATPVDAAGSAASGPISGYMVNSVTMPSCQAAACQNFVISFSSTAGTIPAGSTLLITFPNIPIAGAPDAFMMGSALITGAISSNTLTLTVGGTTGFGGAWAISNTAATTLTLTGMTVANTGLATPSGTPGSSTIAPMYVAVGTTGMMSTTAFSMPYMPTGSGKTTTTSLTVARPFPGVTNTMATIVFSTTNGIASGSTIRVFYPTGFFISAPMVGTCVMTSSTYSLGASGLATCSTFSNTNGGVLSSTTPSMSFVDVRYTGTATAAGAQTVMLSGLTLSATAVSASSTFSVVTTENSCSAGMISTGSISNSNPGGPSAPAAAGTSLLLSAAAALACALLLLL